MLYNHFILDTHHKWIFSALTERKYNMHNKLKSCKLSFFFPFLHKTGAEVTNILTTTKYIYRYYI